MQAVLYGDAAVSAITIANKLYVFVRNLVIGIGQGFQPVAGYNYSAGKRRRAWQAFWFSSLVGTCSARSAPSSWPFSRGRSCGGSAATRRSYALVRRRCASPASFCRCWPSRRSSISSISASATARPRRSWQAAGRAFSSYRAVLLLPLWLHCAGVEMSQPVADLLTFVISMPFLAAFYRHHIRGHAE